MIYQDKQEILNKIQSVSETVHSFASDVGKLNNAIKKHMQAFLILESEIKQILNNEE